MAKLVQTVDVLDAAGAVQAPDRIEVGGIFTYPDIPAPHKRHMRDKAFLVRLVEFPAFLFRNDCIKALHHILLLVAVYQQLTAVLLKLGCDIAVRLGQPALRYVKQKTVLGPGTDIASDHFHAVFPRKTTYAQILYITAV